MNLHEKAFSRQELDDSGSLGGTGRRILKGKKEWAVREGKPNMRGPFGF